MEQPKQPLIPFEPVPVRPRHDGWTAERQIASIEALVATKCADQTCWRVDMSGRRNNRPSRYFFFEADCQATTDQWTRHKPSASRLNPAM